MNEAQGLACPVWHFVTITQKNSCNFFATKMAINADTCNI